MKFFAILSLFLLSTCFDGTNGLGEFLADCVINKIAQDDPVVFPGQPGMSHSHSFFGAMDIDAFSTIDDYKFSDTSCIPLLDHSGYWFPTLFVSGVALNPERITAYYHTFDHFSSVQPIPIGLIMITDKHKWGCLGEGTSGPEIVLCGPGGKLELLLDFPECWNGLDLDSSNHRSHMAFSVGNDCPSSHPILLPRVQYKIRWNTRGGSTVTIASGSGSSSIITGNGGNAHGDFVNAWVPDAMENRVRECSRLNLKCPAVLESDDRVEDIFGPSNRPSTGTIVTTAQRTTALRTTAQQTTAQRTTAFQTTAQRTTALRTTAQQTTAQRTTAQMTTSELCPSTFSQCQCSECICGVM